MITFKKSARTQQVLDRIERKIKELRAPSRSRFAGVQRAIVAGFAENFDTESAGGIPWQPLAPSTVRQRALYGYGGAHPILERDGTYKRSFTVLGGTDHISIFEQSSGKTTVGEGSANPLAAIHETGGSIIPKRQVTRLSSSAKDRTEEELRAVVRGILNG